jgi:hypothetical protein
MFLICAETLTGSLAELEVSVVSEEASQGYWFPALLLVPSADHHLCPVNLDDDFADSRMVVAQQGQAGSGAASPSVLFRLLGRRRVVRVVG